MKNAIQLATISMILTFGQPILVYAQQSQRIAPSPNGISPQTPSNELQQGELKAIREYHSSLLDTVYWTLGIVLGLVLIIIGSSWYTNFRLYEADRARILEEVERRVAEANSRSSRDMQMLSSNLSDKVDRDILALASRVSTEIDRMRSDNKDADRQISSQLKELEEAFEIFLKFPSAIKEQLNRINLNTQLNTERIWELKGNPIKVLLAQFLAFDGAMRTGDNDSIKSVLERMKDNLANSVLPGDKKISSSVLEALQKTLVHAINNGQSEESSVILDLTLVAEILELLGRVATTESS